MTCLSALKRKESSAPKQNKNKFYQVNGIFVQWQETIRTLGVFLNPFAKVYQKLPITVCVELLILDNKSTYDFCDVLCDAVWFTKNIKCTLLYSFIHNSITKYYWQNFAKPLPKAFKNFYFIILSVKSVRPDALLVQNSPTGICPHVQRNKVSQQNTNKMGNQGSALKRKESSEQNKFYLFHS